MAFHVQLQQGVEQGVVNHGLVSWKTFQVVVFSFNILIIASNLTFISKFCPTSLPALGRLRMTYIMPKICYRPRSKLERILEMTRIQTEMQKSQRQGCSWCVVTRFRLYTSAELTQPASAAHCNITFGELVINFPDDYISESINTVIPVLIDMLGSVPNINFDQCLSWQGQLVPWA
jgi:hypothetical protein